MSTHSQSPSASPSQSASTSPSTSPSTSASMSPSTSPSASASASPSGSTSGHGPSRTLSCCNRYSTSSGSTQGSQTKSSKITHMITQGSSSHGQPSYAKQSGSYPGSCGPGTNGSSSVSVSVSSRSRPDTPEQAAVRANSPNASIHTARLLILSSLNSKVHLNCAPQVSRK